MASREKIRPYRRGPWLFIRASDFLVCCMGQCARHTLFETLYKVAVMWMLIPWLKYYVNCNPWIYDLEHRLCQQISTSMSDLGTKEDVADTCRKIISRARQDVELRERENMWCFIPHYPYPPHDRRWALGMQIGGSKYPGKFALIVHTTHAEPSRGRPHFSLGHWKKEHLDKDPQEYHYVLSNSCKEPIYRVMLWYNNPFHILTGWVEASVSTGGVAQGNTKMDGGEHPMWLVTARTKQISGRDSWTGSGMIDAFFDYWLPLFVHEMRFLRWMTIWKDGSQGPWTQAGIHWAHAMGFFEDIGSPEVGTPVSHEQLRQLASHMDISSYDIKVGLLNMGYMETTTWTLAGIDWAQKMGTFAKLSPQPVVNKDLTHPLTQEQLSVLAAEMHTSSSNVKVAMLSMGYAEAKEVPLATAKKKAQQWAESKYQQVISADGVSSPDPRQGRDLYKDADGNPTDVITVMEDISEREFCKCRCCTRSLMGLAETAFGRAMRRHQQEHDLVFDSRGRPLLTARGRAMSSNPPNSWQTLSPGV